jgi:hypothetical protein
VKKEREMVTYESTTFQEESVPELLRIEALEDRFAPWGLSICVEIDVDVKFGGDGCRDSCQNSCRESSKCG